MAIRKEDFEVTYDEEDQAMKERTRITFDISPELRQRIKAAAFQNNVSISEYLGDILEDAVPKDIIYNRELKPLTREKLERVLKVHEEIVAHTYGRTFSDSTELIRQMREERTRELNEL